MKLSVVCLLLVILVANANGFWLKNNMEIVSGSSCEGRCGSGHDPNQDCQCNNKCEKFKDCCDDYHQKCGGGVSDQDLKDFSEQIFGMRRPEVLAKVSLNLQSETTQCGPDHAPNSVYQVADEKAILDIDVVAKLVPLFDNYIANEKKSEEVTPEEIQEEDDFMDAVMNTDEMRLAYQFLHSKDVFKGSYHDFQAHVKKLWFGLFNRGGGHKSSCGFEHVFVGETKGHTVAGQHNWIRTYLLEKSGSLNYKGYIDSEAFQPSNSTAIHGLTSVYNWNDAKKCIGGGLVGTVPQLELALGTVCFKTRSGRACKMSFNSKEFNYKTFPLHYNGYDYISTAYPEF